MIEFDYRSGKHFVFQR